MRRAFYVLGPESSGTRMLTEAFMSAGAYGNSGHEQRIDTYGFADAPDTIVYRSSVPYAYRLPLIKAIYEEMEFAGYDATIIVIDRKDIFLELSQVKREHQRTIAAAKNSIALARNYILEQLETIDTVPVFVQYEDFVDDPDYRKSIFEGLGLPEPDMQFYNANEAYDAA